MSGGGRVDGSSAGRGGVVHGYRPMITTGRPVGLAMLSLRTVSLLADTRHAAAAAAAAAAATAAATAAAGRPRISPSASAASQSVRRAAVPSIARAALQFPQPAESLGSMPHARPGRCSINSASFVAPVVMGHGRIWPAGYL